MAKSRKVYTCENCGNQETKWMGKCSNCGEWNTFVEQIIAAKQAQTARAVLESASTEVMKLSSVDPESLTRLPTFSSEFNLVLNGGFVQNQVILFSGEPGIGKSTLLLQTAVGMTNKDVSALYVSAEESASQVAGRAHRIFGEDRLEKLDFLSTGSLAQIMGQMTSGKYKLVVIDSIQTIFDDNLSSLPGSLTQIKSCASSLVSLAKQTDLVLILVGHINKDGNIAGPKALEHLVDSVLQLEGERSGQYRILRSLKNRFGTTGEVGIFNMAEEGMRDVSPEDNVLAGSTEDEVGIAKTIAIEGNRPLLVEVQALTNKTVYAYPKRVAEGLSTARLQLITAILERFAKVDLSDVDIYVRVTGGYKLSSPSSDLGIAAAILSSLKNKKLEAPAAFVGELSLSGKLYLSQQLRNKLGSASKLGVEKLFTPGKVKKSRSFKHVQVERLGELLKG